MAIQFDTHVHTSFSTDSSTPPVEQLNKVLQLGMSGICITDHMDYHFPPSALDHPVEGIPFCFDWNAYQETMKEIRQNTAIALYTGVECGLQKSACVIEKNTNLSLEPALDYMIGSLHLVEGKDPYYPSFWQGKNPSQCIQYYFEILYENLKLFHSVDSLGHMDYIVRYAPADYVYVPENFREIIEAILELLIRKDIALEVNTSGWKTEGRYQNPHVDILNWYCQKGGELVTVGSDAHSPEYLAYRFDEIVNLLKRTGLRQYAVYQKHKPVFYDL